MQRLKISLFALVILIFAAFKSDKTAYQLFSKEGKTITFEKMLKSLQNADIVFFGELHDNPIAHWLQYELTRDLHAIKGKNLIIGGEMFETDNQILLDEYFNGDIKESSFESEARLWKNYKTDYKPLVEFAKDSGLRFVATNIPRRYAAAVSSNGLESLDSLSSQAKKYIADLPMLYDGELSAYKSMMDMMEDMPHANENIPKAQAVKDATMAKFILKNWSEGKLFLHFNGAYHSDDFQGIVWYLHQSNPNLKILTISCVEEENVSELEEKHLQKADYILATPKSMTKTYFTKGM